MCWRSAIGCIIGATLIFYGAARAAIEDPSADAVALSTSSPAASSDFSQRVGASGDWAVGTGAVA